MLSTEQDLIPDIWGKIFKNGPSKIFEILPLKNVKWYGLLGQIVSLQMFKRLSSTKFTWSILEHFAPYANKLIFVCAKVVNNFEKIICPVL